MQIALKHVAEAIEVQIIEVVVEWILTAIVINIGEDDRVNMNTYISCPISRKPSNKNEVNAVALETVIELTSHPIETKDLRDGQPLHRLVDLEGQEKQV